MHGCGSGVENRVPEPLSQPEPLETGAGETIWEGQSGGISIRWATVDLFAKSDAKTERIWGPLVRKGFEDFTAVAVNGDPAKRPKVSCSYGRQFRILSIVGPLVSFEDQYSDDCGGAHPSADTRFTSVDLSKPDSLQYARQEDTPMMNVDLAKPGKIVKLTDYFAEQDVLRALLGDRVVQKALAGLRRSTPPRTLAELPELFAADDYALGDLDFELRPDFLTRFAFHHLEGDKVAVRLGLPPHSGASRTEHQQLGLLLPMKQDFAYAASRRHGFLMLDAAQTSGGRATTFSLRTSAK
jgi:hypothetical protein